MGLRFSNWHTFSCDIRSLTPKHPERKPTGSKNYAILLRLHSSVIRSLRARAWRMWRTHKSFTPFGWFSAVHQTMLSKTCWESKIKNGQCYKWEHFFLFRSRLISHIYIWIEPKSEWKSWNENGRIKNKSFIQRSGVKTLEASEKVWKRRW